MPIQDRITRHLVGLFWLIVAIVAVEICIFSTCFLWNHPPIRQLQQTLLAESMTRSSNMHRTLIASVALALGGLFGQGAALAPIPLRPPGFIYSNGSCNAPIQIEAWLDPICPDCKAAWQTYQRVADFYGPETVRFSALMFPLPYHRAAMAAAQGAFVAETLDQSKTYDWLSKVFENQKALYNGNIAEQPDSYIVNALSEWASQVGYSKAQFKMHLAGNDPTQSLARIEFKYGATRGVYGVPQVFINGAVISSDPHWTLSDWKDIIDPLLAKYKYFYKHN